MLPSTASCAPSGSPSVGISTPWTAYDWTSTSS
jgi:hypothetical protein